MNTALIALVSYFSRHANWEWSLSDTEETNISLSLSHRLA